ncbi:MAG TPA: PilX N-terminal domain-containing pilus assembly protein [Gallionella sp.]|nr:PilX N-terminal domain-containing pilus assembly protein [Gallionella sp.]
MSTRNSQRGATLFVGLVMLVVLTLLVISAIRSSNTDLRIAGNMQMQGEAAAAAQQTIEQIISSNFTTDPAASIASAVAGAGAITPDYALAASAVCIGSVPISNSNLNPANPSESPCVSSSAASNTGVISSSGKPVKTGDSWCYAQQWDVQASAVSSAGTGANATTHQGVHLRVPAGTGCS